MYKTFAFISGFLFLISCSSPKNDRNTLDELAGEYVKLGLLIGHYDNDFVDAYYGPDSLLPENPEEYDAFPTAILLEKVNALKELFQHFLSQTTDSELIERADFILAQLNASEERIRIVSGETTDFDEESKRLFGVAAPVYQEAYFQETINKLGQLLPGSGDVQDRYRKLGQRFIIPSEKLDTVLKAAIAEARLQTKEHYPVPEKESFNLEYVGNKPWSGYNWYKGNYTSLIQINTDFPISIERVIDVGSHESYPGHHFYNMLLEENLYHKKGYIETSLYPLFSPQSLIAEGSANYGIELAFPGERKITFCKEVLLPLAGLDTSGITSYFNALELVTTLNYAGNEVARGILNGTMTEEQGISYLIRYGFYTPEKARQRIDFTKKYRSYVINYNYGTDLIRHYIEQNAGSLEKKWKIFGELLSRQLLPGNLL
jgi:hypothetical protein